MISAPPLALLVKTFPKLSETFVMEEVLGLERLGAQVRVYTLEPPSDAVQHAAAKRVRAACLTVPPVRLGFGLDHAARHAQLLLSRPLRYLSALRQAAARGREGLRAFVRAGWLSVQLDQDGIDHVHAHFINTPADVAELVSELSGKTFSLSAHAKDIYLGDVRDLRRKLEAAKFTVSCTEFNCRALRAMSPVARVYRMYHGVDHGVFNHGCKCKTPSSPPVVLAVGRLREKKGFDTLIEACSLLRARGQSFRCDIVGYGEQQTRLQALIEHHALADVVCLVGKRTREELLTRYGSAAVFVQPSRVTSDGDRDGIPNVLLEAMAVGVPVVATCVSGIPEVIHDDRNGLLVEPDDPGALAHAIGNLLDDQRRGGAKTERLVDAAGQTVRTHFDNDRNLHVVLGLLGRELPHPSQVTVCTT